MSEIKHTSLKGELLYLIGRATAPMSGTELYDRCELADEIATVSKALANLQSDGKIIRAKGEGRARYILAPGIAAPAPAGKGGRPHRDDETARPSPLHIPTLAESIAAMSAGEDAMQTNDDAMPVIHDLPPPPEPAIGAESRPLSEREKGKIEAAFRRAQKCTAREFAPSDASLADAIIARLKTDLGPMLRPYIGESIEAEAGVGGLSVHVHIEQIDIHMGGL